MDWKTSILQNSVVENVHCTSYPMTHKNHDTNTILQHDKFSVICFLVEEEKEEEEEEEEEKEEEKEDSVCGGFTSACFLLSLRNKSDWALNEKGRWDKTNE